MLKIKSSNLLKSLASFGLIGILAACGGGGDDGDTTSSTDFDSTDAAKEVEVVSGDTFETDPQNTVSWEAVDGADEYVIYYGLVENEVTENSEFLVSQGTQVVHEGVVAGQTYHYRVQAKSGDQSGTLSEEAEGTPQTAKVPQQLNDGTYNGIQLVAVGDSGVILVSPNGTTDEWNLVDPTPTTQSLAAIIWAPDNQEFLMVGAGGTVLSTADLANFQQEDSTVSTDLEDVALVGDQYIAVGKSSTVITSANDGIWTQVNTDAINKTLKGIASDGETIVVVGTNGTMLTSTLSSLGDPNPWTDLTDNIIDGVTINQDLNDVTYDGDRFIVVGSNDTVLTGEFVAGDLVWTKHIPGTPDITFNGASQWDDGIPAEPILAAVGSAGTFVISPDAGTVDDGVEGIIIPTGTTESLTAVTWVESADGDYFVIVGNNGTVLTNQQ